MPRKRSKEKPEKANPVEETSKQTVRMISQQIGRPTPIEKLPPRTFDEYQCLGNVEIDFPGLCAFLDMKNIPIVSTKQPACTHDNKEEDSEGDGSAINATPMWRKPHLHVELESEVPLSADFLKVSGWKVDEQVFRVLQKMLPSLRQLQSLQFWQAGLTDGMVKSLVDTISLCSNLSSVTLEGNPLPEQSFSLLLSEDSTITHLSLRNNQIGDEGARVIGSALSTPKSANKNLLLLNLAFNSIGDAGATHIAQGLRLNRALLCLSLSNNQIGDSGAAHLAAILCEFVLTHEEVVERRKLLLEGTQSLFSWFDSELPAGQLSSVSSSTSPSFTKLDSKSKKREAQQKDEKPASTIKENPKPNKKSSNIKVSQSKGGKPGSKEKQLPEQEEIEAGENPLLDPWVQCRDGELILPGNTTLTSLNLAGNRITEKSLPLFLTSLEMQSDREGGLLRLCLQRNRFPPESDNYVKIKEVMALRDPFEESREEGQGS